MSWYLTNIARNKNEREGLEAFAVNTDWFLPIRWRFDQDMHLVLEADIIVGARTFPITLQYPEMFPFAAPSVFPRGDTTRWSSHQFGPGGELCLEFGPDNWTQEMTGVQIIESAHRLLSGENPSEGQPEIVASRHANTLGQQLRGTYTRLLVTRDLAAFFDSLPPRTTITGNLLFSYHAKSTTYILKDVTAPVDLVWTNAKLPEPLVEEGGKRRVIIFKIEEGAALPPTDSLPSFRAACASIGFKPDYSFVILLRGAEVNFYVLWEDDQTVGLRSVLPPQSEQQRVDASHGVLNENSVALIGCGSLGSKVSTMLARAGVRRLFLADDDILFPDNFIRHDLDWRDVGSHKADALSRRLKFVNPAVEVAVLRMRLGGQEANISAETLMKFIGGCDLIFDATAEPDVLNLVSAVASYCKKPVVWAEVFGGGIGGLIARSRPEIEPLPQHMRRAIENWFAEKDATPIRSRRDYDAASDGAPLIADDADVSAIAAHAARFAIDLLIGRDPSLFPSSVYAIGLGVGSVFDQPFQTFPIEVGPPPVTQSAAELSPEESMAEIDRLMALFKARADETAAAASNN